MPTDRYRPQPVQVKLIRALAKSKAPTKPKEIRDNTTHLILRHQPSGYLGLYVELGRGKRERICNALRVIDPNDPLTFGQVKTEAQRLRGQSASGRDFKSERDSRRAIPTLNEYLDDTYGPLVTQPPPKGLSDGRGQLARIKACFADDFGHLKLSEITPARIETWRANRKVKAETINRDLTALRGALSRAVDLEIIPASPIARIRDIKIDKSKRVVRALTAGEKAKLLRALVERDASKREKRGSANQWRKNRRKQPLPAIGRFADPLSPAVIVAIETGLRRREMLSLEWPFVDFEKKELHIKGETAKSFTTRDIPLNEAAYKALRDWWLQGGQATAGYVFALDGERVGSLKKAYYGVLEAAAIDRINARGERINWHSLRHTFGTLLGAGGVDGATLKELMGHANLETTQRYLHTDEERKRAAVELLGTG